MSSVNIIAFKHDPDNNSIILTTLRLFDSNFNIMAQIDDNGFWVRPDARSKRPSPGSLIVYNSADEEALNIDYMNPKVIKITGIFYAKGARKAVITNKEFKLGNATITDFVSAFGRTAISIDPKVPPILHPQAQEQPNKQEKMPPAR